jgi:hypothetical protein
MSGRGAPFGGPWSRTLSAMAIITAEDLATYMARELANEAAATEIIDGLEADLEAYLKRPLVPTEITDEEVTIDTLGRVYTKATPVSAVAAFTVDGTAVSADAYLIRPYGLTYVSPVFLPSPLISPAPVMLLDYTGGLPGDDPTDPFTRKARATLLRAAARDYNQVVREDLAGVARAGVEGTNLEFHGGVKAGAGGLTEDEMAKFNRWKRRIAR